VQTKINTDYGGIVERKIAINTWCGVGLLKALGCRWMRVREINDGKCRSGGRGLV